VCVFVCVYCVPVFTYFLILVFWYVCGVVRVVGSSSAVAACEVCGKIVFMCEGHCVCVCICVYFGLWFFVFARGGGCGLPITSPHLLHPR